MKATIEISEKDIKDILESHFVSAGNKVQTVSLDTMSGFGFCGEPGFPAVFAKIEIEVPMPPLQKKAVAS